MKLIHSADWHLGRVLHNESLLEDQAHVLEQMANRIDVVPSLTGSSANVIFL